MYVHKGGDGVRLLLLPSGAEYGDVDRGQGQGQVRGRRFRADWGRSWSRMAMRGAQDGKEALQLLGIMRCECHYYVGIMIALLPEDV